MTISTNPTGGPPSGLGWWIAFERTLAPGPRADDLQLAIDRCRATGATWVALRAGAGGYDDADLTEESIRAFDAAGIDVYLWIFNYPNTTVAELVDWKRWRSILRQGEPSSIRPSRPLGEPIVRGAILNAEFEYQAATPQQARAMVASLRALGYAFVAHAPPDYLGAGVGHALSDELVALDEDCDAIMPQTYSWEHDDLGHVHNLQRVTAGYASRGYGPEKVWPVGAAYRPPTRGYTTDAAGKKVGKKTPPMADEARRVADDAVAFMDHPWVQACPAPSFYALDAVSRINGAKDQVIEALAARHARQPATSDTDPAALLDGGGLVLGDGGAAVDPYTTDRLEQRRREFGDDD